MYFNAEPVKHAVFPEVFRSNRSARVRATFKQIARTRKDKDYFRVRIRVLL
jgi:hypothetical protein